MNTTPPQDDAREIVRKLREAQQLVSLIGLGDMNAAVDLRNRALAGADMIEAILTRIPSQEATEEEREHEFFDKLLRRQPRKDFDDMFPGYFKYSQIKEALRFSFRITRTPAKRTEP